MKQNLTELKGKVHNLTMVKDFNISPPVMGRTSSQQFKKDSKGLNNTTNLTSIEHFIPNKSRIYILLKYMWNTLQTDHMVVHKTT